MILNNHYKFLFLNQRRTSSTTLETMLSGICAPDDIISKINRVSEDSRNELGGKSPQNHLEPTKPYTYGLFLDSNISNCVFHNIKQLIKYIPLSQKLGYSDSPRFHGWKLKEANQKFYAHMPVSLLLKHIGEEKFNGLFKFTVVRNPFDQFLSWYFWQQATGGRSVRSEFKPFLRKRAEEFFDSNKRVILVNGKTVVDDVLRYEHLVEDFFRINKKLNLPEKTIQSYDEITTNGFTRKTRGYDLIDTEAKELIIEKADYFFTQFGYSRDVPT